MPLGAHVLAYRFPPITDAGLQISEWLYPHCLPPAHLYDLTYPYNRTRTFSDRQSGMACVVFETEI